MQRGWICRVVKRLDVVRLIEVYTGEWQGAATLIAYIESDVGKEWIPACWITESWPPSDTVLPGKTSHLAEGVSIHEPE